MYFSAIQNALYYAADNGADIISMSFGAATTSHWTVDNAIQYAYNAGVTLLAATGPHAVIGAIDDLAPLRELAADPRLAAGVPIDGVRLEPTG